MKHTIIHENFVTKSHWVCACGEKGTTQEEFLKHQLEHLTEEEVIKQVTLKLYWTITCDRSKLGFNDRITGVDEMGFFIFTNEEDLAKDIEQIGECINQHINHNLDVRRVTTKLYKCTEKEYRDWRSFFIDLEEEAKNGKK